MISLALALMLGAPQGAPDVWTRISEEEGRVIEVANLQAQGDLRFVDVRLSAPGDKRSVVASVVFNCPKATSWMVGDARLYVDGKLTETRPAPDSVKQETAVDDEGMQRDVYVYACAPVATAK